MKGAIFYLFYITHFKDFIAFLLSYSIMLHDTDKEVMKLRTAIITDSTAVLNPEFVAMHDNLIVLPLQILFKDEVFEEGINIDSDLLFKLTSLRDELPTTSQPSIGRVITVFEDLKKNYDEVLYITISSKISGTHATGLLAAGQVEGIKVGVFDSLSTSVIQKMMVHRAVELANKGFGIDEIVTNLRKLRDEATIYLVVDDLKHLGRTGRINNVSAVVGALLKIKPILKFEDGHINLFKKVRTLKSAYKEVLELLEKENVTDKTLIVIAHASGEENAKKVKEMLKVKYPNKNIEINELSPVISVHTGPNSVGVAWIHNFFEK